MYRASAKSFVTCLERSGVRQHPLPVALVLTSKVVLRPGLLSMFHVTKKNKTWPLSKAAIDYIFHYVILYSQQCIPSPLHHPQHPAPSFPSPPPCIFHGDSTGPQCSVRLRVVWNVSPGPTQGVVLKLIIIHFYCYHFEMYMYSP